MATPNRIKRYTTLAAAIDMLANKRIALLSPSTWTDKNDTYFLSAYCKECELKSVVAACFTQAAETYHHWEIYAGKQGVCVEFHKDALIDSLRKRPNYRWRTVEYKSLSQIRAVEEVDVYDLPFWKRQGFEHEDEFRLIYESKSSKLGQHYVNIELAWINRIILNPWMPPGLTRTLKSTLKEIAGEDVRVTKSTLIDNAEWKQACERIDEFGALLGPPPNP